MGGLTMPNLPPSLVQAACFCAAQFLSSFPWGKISDVVGRKPMLVMSNLSSCISVIGFGLSDSFLMAALFRSAGGLFNCTFVYAANFSRAAGFITSSKDQALSHHFEANFKVGSILEA